MKVSGQLQALEPLYPRRKTRQYPFDMSLGGSQSPSGLGGEEKKIPLLPPPGIEPRSSSLWPSLRTYWAASAPIENVVAETLGSKQLFILFNPEAG
jgi:hypothetical protein